MASGRSDPARNLSGRSRVRRQWQDEAARLEVDENVARELEPGPEPDGGRRAHASARGEASSAEDLTRFDVEHEPGAYVVMSMRAAEAAALEHEVVKRARASEALHGTQGNMSAQAITARRGSVPAGPGTAQTLPTSTLASGVFGARRV